jgi:hypothetical protein
MNDFRKFIDCDMRFSELPGFSCDYGYPFLPETGGRMDNMWEKIKKSLKDGAALSMEKIEEYTKLGKLKVEEMAAKRKIERNFIDIGERVYDLLEEGKGETINDDLTVKKASENVTALREELTELEQKMREVSENAKRGREENEDEDDEVNGI